MAAATTLPDDFVLEYDLLQFVANDDHLGLSGDQPLYPASTASTAAAASSSSSSLQMLNVDDLLGNSFVSLDSIVDGSCDIISGDASSVATPAHAAKEQDLLLNVTATFGATGGDDELAEFLINGEEFLNEMEKVVKMDMDTHGCFSDSDHNGQLKHTSSSTSESSSSLSSPRFDQDFDVDALTDADIMSSPCPSSCPSSTNEFMSSPSRGDFDEHSECSLLKEQQHAWMMAQSLSPMATPLHAPTHLLPIPDKQMHQNTIDLSTEDETEAEEEIEVDFENADDVADAEVKVTVRPPSSFS